MNNSKPNAIILPLILGIIGAILTAHNDGNDPMWIPGFILGVVLGIIINWQRSIRRGQK
jgi:hypothetical protein